MKFKDNIFYQTYEFKKQNNDFEPISQEQSGCKFINIYKFDVGLCMVLEDLIYLTATSNANVYVSLENGSIDGEAWEVLDALKDVDVKDVKSVSIAPKLDDDTESCTREPRMTDEYVFDFENNLMKSFSDYV